jgi:hypothetical protein
VKITEAGTVTFVTICSGSCVKGSELRSLLLKKQNHALIQSSSAAASDFVVTAQRDQTALDTLRLKWRSQRLSRGLCCATTTLLLLLGASDQVDW